MKMLPVGLFVLMSSLSSAQNTFSLGATVGYGTSAFPMDAQLRIDGVSNAAKSGAIISTGLIGRYMIGDRFGIESGFWLNHYSFYFKDKFRRRDSYWKSAAEVEVVNYQLPILLNYKLNITHHPFRYFAVGAGTTLDLFLISWDTSLDLSLTPRSFQNILGYIKFGKEKTKGNKYEFGLDIQYSLKSFEFSNIGYYGPAQYFISSRINMVSLSLSYFFLKKEHNSHEI